MADRLREAVGGFGAACSHQEVVPGLFAEVNLSANHLRNLIRDLLKTFQIPETEITIYLRQDRDADGESE